MASADLEAQYHSGFINKLILLGFVIQSRIILSAISFDILAGILELARTK
jgi:hypothetical protein